MPRSGGKRKKRRTHKVEEEGESQQKRTPRCFVIRRGGLGRRMKDLITDFRIVMSPNCAKNLKESKSNRLEDFTAVAGPMNVSHLVMFSSTKVASYMKLTKLPQGPTLTFKIDSFSLMHDVRMMQRKPRTGPRDFTVAPLQVLNGFSGADDGGEKRLIAEMLRGLFPPVDLPTFSPYDCRRAALFHYDKQEDCVHFRHFSVGRKVVGLQRGVQKLLRTNRLPKLGKQEDMADFILSGGAGGVSESEMEDAEEIPLANRVGGKTAVRLTEVGPRMELKLIKVEEGVNGGAVLYHRFNAKAPSQTEVYEQRAREKRKLQARNAFLEEKFHGKKREIRTKAKQKAANIASNTKGGGEDDDGGAAALPDDDDDDDGPASSGPKRRGGGGAAGEAAASGTKRKRFHPFAFGAKAGKKAAQGKEKTVEMDSGPPAKKARTGGKGGGGGGKGGGGKGKGGGKGGKKKMSVLDKFHASGRSK